MRTSFIFAVVLISISPLVWADLIPHAGHPAPLPFAPFLPHASQASYICTHRVDADADFLIVGTGVTGLGAAHYLHAHTRGCVIRILDTRESEYQLGDGSYVNWTLDVPEDLMVAVAKAHGLVVTVRTNTPSST
jgi:hypothetical protein